MRKIIKKILLIIKNRNKKIKIGKNCNIGIKTVFEGMNVIQDDTIFNGFIGYGSYLGRNCYLSAKIGRFCSIAPQVTVAQGSHPTDTFVSTHPTFFSMQKQNGETFVENQKFNELKYADDKKNCIVVGNDVWIGANVTILSGVTIGDGAIIAAGSVVVNDVEPYAIVGGVPAKTIRYRFNVQQIDYLLKLQWWNKEVDWIRQNAKYFDDIEKFMIFNQKNHGGKKHD